MVSQAIVAEFCASGAIDALDRHGEGRAPRAPRRHLPALGEHFPDARFVTPEGGYFLWVDLPDGTDVAAIEAAAKERGVVFVKGTDFLLEGGESSFRLAYSGVPPEQIREAISRLAAARAGLPAEESLGQRA